MDELILKHLAGDTTDVEERRLEKWRSESAQHEARFREAKVLWDGLGSFRTPTPTFTPDVDGMLHEAERRRARARAKRSRRALLLSPWAGYGLAAAATLVLSLLAARLWRVEGPPPRAAGGLSAVESSVGTGEEVAMTLSDGSYVRARAGTRLEFPGAAGRREVLLDGRAFFAVARASEPFVVRAGAAEVTVLGTRFEVRTEGDLLRVVVVEGVVGIAARGGDVELREGQVATVRGAGAPVVVDADDVWALLQWPGGLLAFQRTALAEVARQLTRHYGVDVRVEDPGAAELTVTGSFRDASVDGVVEAICAVTGIRCEEQDDGFVLGVVESSEGG